ncbi:Cytochrome c-like domain containing protein [Comamonadaceae bacterium]
MNKTIRTGLMAWALLISWGLACAQGGPAPDVGAGKKRAAACFACHGENGISKIPGTPHLAGQERSYLESALRAYRDGQTRQNVTMNAMAKPLSDRDIANVAAYFSLLIRMDKGQTATQAMELLERIRPVGVVATEVAATPVAAGAAGTAPVAAKSGESVYTNACIACHGSGVAGAPKLGDKAAWAPRLAQGGATLVQHATQGFKGMPAKGACTTCSDADIKAAVEYLAGKSK